MPFWYYICKLRLQRSIKVVLGCLREGESLNPIIADQIMSSHLFVKTSPFSLFCSAEYGSVVDVSFKAAVNVLVDEMSVQSGGSLMTGMPLAKLVPRVIQMGPSLLDEPSKNRICQIIRSIPEVQLFFTLVYANIST